MYILSVCPPVCLCSLCLFVYWKFRYNSNFVHSCVNDLQILFKLFESCQRLLHVYCLFPAQEKKVRLLCVDIMVI